MNEDAAGRETGQEVRRVREIPFCPAASRKSEWEDGVGQKRTKCFGRKKPQV